MTAAVDLRDIALRLSLAVCVGVIIGLDRELRGKSFGMRTMALVTLGAALACVTAVYFAPLQGNPDAISRVVQGVIQGVMAGVGFLGAGAVVRRPGRRQTDGLTTAATVWVAAALGVACGLADWPVVGVGVALTMFVLVLLHFAESIVERRFGDRLSDGED